MFFCSDFKSSVSYMNTNSRIPTRPYKRPAQDEMSHQVQELNDLQSSEHQNQALMQYEVGPVLQEQDANQQLLQQLCKTQQSVEKNIMLLQNNIQSSQHARVGQLKNTKLAPRARSSIGRKSQQQPLFQPSSNPLFSEQRKGSLTIFQRDKIKNLDKIYKQTAPRPISEHSGGHSSYDWHKDAMKKLGDVSKKILNKRQKKKDISMINEYKQVNQILRNIRCIMNDKKEKEQVRLQQNARAESSRRGEEGIVNIQKDSTSYLDSSSSHMNNLGTGTVQMKNCFS